MEEKTIIALEIGSSKIKGASGTVGADGTLTVKAVEEEPISDIVRYGCIRNIVETTRAVQNVISRLEKREAPQRLEGVYISLGGRSLNVQSVDVTRDLPMETEITEEILRDITLEALNYPLNDRTIVDAAPREVLVDKISTPKPVGILGSHILARFNVVHCRPQLIRNQSTVICDKLNLRIMDTFVRPTAIADLVLLNEEKRLGCMLVDFGAETTTVAIYRNGVLQHLAVLPMGSRNITRDITALNYLEEEAEELKCQRGSAFPTHESKSAPGQPDFVAINNYASARAGEIIVNIAEQVKYAGLTPEKLAKGIVIVGRGARLSDFNKRLEQLTGMTVRTGTPGNRVRILDGRIQAADSVDVIAILNKAAQSDPQSCVVDPNAVQPVAEPEQNPYAQSAQPYQPAQQPVYGPQYPQQPQQPVQTPSYTPQQPVQPQYPQQGGQTYQPAAAQQQQPTPQQPVQQPVQTPYGQSQQGYTQPVQQGSGYVHPSQQQGAQHVQTGFNQPIQHHYGQPEVLRPEMNAGGGAPTPVDPSAVAPAPQPDHEQTTKKGGIFKGFYSALANKVANLISDGFEEEDDE